MTRQEYLSELDSHLISLPDEEREMAVNFYSEYFDEAGAENEAAVIDELGKPFQLAKSVISEQSAYSKSEVYIKYRESNPISNNNGGGVYVSFKKESAPYTPPTYRESSSKASVGINESDIMPNSSPAGTAEADGNRSNTQTKADSIGNNSYNAGNNYGDYSNRNDSPFGNTNFSKSYKSKKRMSVWMIILLVFFIIFIFIPIIIPAIATLFGLFFGLVAIIVACLAAGAACIVAGIVCWVIGIARIFTGPLDGVVMIASGCLFAGIGILIFIPCLILCIKTIPWCFKGLCSIVKKITRRGKNV